MTLCIWKNEDVDLNTWETECGHAFCVNEGNPLENDMRFCCFCGEALIEEIVKEEDEND